MTNDHLYKFVLDMISTFLDNPVYIEHFVGHYGRYKQYNEPKVLRVDQRFFCTNVFDADVTIFEIYMTV